MQRSGLKPVTDCITAFFSNTADLNAINGLLEASEVDSIFNASWSPVQPNSNDVYMHPGMAFGSTSEYREGELFMRVGLDQDVPQHTLGTPRDMCWVCGRP